MFRQHHIRTAIALTLALAAAAPSAASARPAPDPPPATGQTQPRPAVNPHSRDAANPAIRAIQAQGARVARELAPRDAASGTEIMSPPPAEIVTVFQPNRFDWGDAEIGAGATLGLILILLGSTLYLTHRHTPPLASHADWTPQPEPGHTLGAGAHPAPRRKTHGPHARALTGTPASVTGPSNDDIPGRQECNG